ncbi:hypothetical protein VPHF86_0162 [Vibrio phage F86]
MGHLAGLIGAAQAKSIPLWVYDDQRLLRLTRKAKAIATY